jgi:hypothetical protein
MIRLFVDRVYPVPEIPIRGIEEMKASFAFTLHVTILYFNYFGSIIVMLHHIPFAPIYTLIFCETTVPYWTLAWSIAFLGELSPCPNCCFSICNSFTWGTFTSASLSSPSLTAFRFYFIFILTPTDVLIG